MEKHEIVREQRIIPQRIKEAREYCLMSAADLADKIDLSRQAISQFENGATNPTIENLQKIAYATNFPMQYFYKERRPQNSSPSQMPLYRGSPTKTRKLKRSYEIAASFSDDIIYYLKKYVIFTEPNFPGNFEFDYTNDIDSINNIEEIVEKLRNHWSIGKGPVHDLVGVLENNGVIISKIPNKVKEVEAFSLWYEKVPHIFYEGNRNTTASYNFSICHELGHLILHRNVLENEAVDDSLYKKLEEQANLFAGAFLLPAETFGNEYITSNLDSFIAIKKRWGVSLGAMIMRAHVLGIIDKQQKSYLFRQLSASGYRKKEPYDDEMVFEGPSLLFNLVKTLVERKIVDIQDFISAFSIPINDLNAICSFPVGFINQYLYNERDIPQLRIVK